VGTGVPDVEVGQKMAAGRIRRSARRGIAVAVLGWLGVAAAAVVLAPGASAAPTYTVHIRDLTPPVATVDPGGTVTFVNEIADKKLSVGVGGLSVVQATVHTDVTLQLPSGKKPLPAGAGVSEKFAGPCGCTITYSYRVDGALLNQVLPQLPALPAPTPFVVNTVVPAVPNLPSVNLPQLPEVNVEVPTLPGLPGGGTPMAPGGPVAPPTGGGAGGGAVPPAQDAPGTPYAYNTGTGAPRLSPADIAAAAAFDPARYYVPGRSLGGPDGAGAGGVAGGYDGASVPVFGQLAGLDSAGLDQDGATPETAADATPAGRTLPAAALAAVVALAAVTAALVRTHQATRAGR
jgi:hypothetical protein